MRRILAIAGLLLLAGPALAGTLLWSTSLGDVNFPGLTPSTIDGMTVGQTTQAAVGASQVKIDSGTKTAAATSGAATLNKMAGVITSEALSTAAGATYTLTLTNANVAAADQVFASVQLGTATTGTPTVATVTPAAGSMVVVVQNIHATAALNGTIKISFVVFKN